MVRPNCLIQWGLFGGKKRDLGILGRTKEKNNGKILKRVARKKERRRKEKLSPLTSGKREEESSLLPFSYFPLSVMNRGVNRGGDWYGYELHKEISEV